MSRARSPNTSPWRSPHPAVTTAVALYRSGKASMTASTCSTGQGCTFFCWRDGSRTERALHGFVAMSPSSTAAVSTVEALVKIVRTYVGARSCWSPRNHA